MSKAPRYRLSILVLVTASVLATVSVVLAAPLLTAKSVTAMGANPSSCNNIYATTFTSMRINNGTMSFDPIANPGMTFAAKNHVGYNITYVLHAANQSLAGNILPGSAFLSTTAYGAFVHDECDGGFVPNVDKSFTVSIPYSGFEP